jgi:hypothetical protein
MVNPSVMQQLAREYRRDDLAHVHTRGLALRLSHHPIRERVGWSLVGLGLRLTKDPMTGAVGQARSAAPVAGGHRGRTSVPRWGGVPSAV